MLYICVTSLEYLLFCPFYLSGFKKELLKYVLKLVIHFFILFFYYYFKNLFIFGCVGSLLLCAGFLHLRQVRATLHCGARASHCGGFSCCGARALGERAQ